MKLLSRENLLRILGYVFIISGFVFLYASIFDYSETTNFNNQQFALSYGIVNIVTGFAFLKKLAWAPYAFVTTLILELAGEAFFTDSGIQFNDIFFFFAGLAAGYYLFQVKGKSSQT